MARRCIAARLLNEGIPCLVIQRTGLHGVTVLRVWRHPNLGVESGKYPGVELELERGGSVGFPRSVGATAMRENPVVVGNDTRGTANQ